MVNEFQFDVFLSHSAKDKAVVRELAARLQQDGVRVWLDEEQLPSPAGAGGVLRPSDGKRWRSRMREDTWPGEGRGAEADSIPAKIEAGLEHSNFGFPISDFRFAQPGMSANAFGSDRARQPALSRPAEQGATRPTLETMPLTTKTCL
jgi:hypothetical protein